ncbi:hypothetical protein AC1031_017249 [Aphanomyces cochlioides]|nr:hypothetical protein AC1031_017249 [Aphanomyces cochlioides]
MKRRMTGLGALWQLQRRSLATKSTAPLKHPVCDAFRAIILQQRSLLLEMTDDEYRFRCPTLQGTTGGHIRHALDHLSRSLAIRDSTIRYDIRERNTNVEVNRLDAIDAMNKLGTLATTQVDEAHLHKPVDAMFMLSGDGNEVKLQSTVEREMAFAVHHAIHHNALIKVILMTHFPHVPLPPQFGVAPSTIHFLSTHPADA